MTWRPWVKAPKTKLDPNVPCDVGYLDKDQKRAYRNHRQFMARCPTYWTEAQEHAAAWKAAVECETQS